MTSTRVLTVRQPWASAFFVPAPRGKDIENRLWSPGRPGVIAIHAGLQVDEEALTTVGVPRHLDRNRGVILGTVDVTSYHRAGSPACMSMFCDANPWAQWPDADADLWHWVIEHPRLFVTPIKARGALGLWRPGPTVRHLIQIAEVVA